MHSPQFDLIHETVISTFLAVLKKKFTALCHITIILFQMKTMKNNLNEMNVQLPDMKSSDSF